MGSLRYSSFAMKRAFLSVLTTILIVAMTLGAMFTLVRATVWVTSIESPLQRSVGIVAELFLGVVLLLGTVWLATHLAVRIFGVKESSPQGGPLG
jgi:heme/copper-type cytochrome/quinol oxidase subunit 3